MMIVYYPKQIPYLLDQEFRKYIEYVEYKIPELKEYCMCVWQMKSNKILDQTIDNYILPDACIDIVIDFTRQTISFAGFSKETEQFHLNKRIDYMGVRLKPGAFYTIFHIDADHIMDHVIDFKEIEKDADLEKILLFSKLSKRIEILKNYLLKKIKPLPEKKFIQLIDQLYENPKEQTVVNIATSFGYDKRHLSRIFKIHYGISPKILLNIVRLHLCLTLLLEDKKSIMDIAFVCGFYDQSHFIKEIKRYTGISPVQLLKYYNQ